MFAKKTQDFLKMASHTRLAMRGHAQQRLACAWARASQGPVAGLSLYGLAMCSITLFWLVFTLAK